MSKTSKNKPKIEPINRNKAVLSAKIESMIKNGRKEITTKKQLEKFPIGSLISYFNNENIYRSGGYIKKFGDDYFVYLTSDFERNVRVRYKNVSKMFAGNVYETKNDVVSIVPSKAKKSKHFAKIGDTVVLYATTATLVTRYEHTQKYLRMKKWHELFGDE
jgi:hypothetical protein